MWIDKDSGNSSGDRDWWKVVKDFEILAECNWIYEVEGS